MGKERTSKPAKHHRCRVVLNIRFTEGERGISLGPGSIVDEREYVEMMEKKLATSDMFEPVAQEIEPRAAEESES